MEKHEPRHVATVIVATVVSAYCLTSGGPAAAADTTSATSPPARHLADLPGKAGTALRDRPDWVTAVTPGTPKVHRLADPAGATVDTAPATTAKALPYDINGDGYREVIVGAPGENLGPDFNAGMFHVFFGSAAGVTVSGSQVFDQDTPGVPGSTEDGDQLGWTNTSGDFNADDYADVAVAANTEDLGSAVDAGMVDGFGWTVAAGDVNGDGTSDLVAGSIYDWEDRGWSTGAAYVLYGGEFGLSGAHRFSKDTPGVPGGPGTFDYSKDDTPDRFGWQVTLADFNGDAKADLAVGALGSPVYVDGVRKRDAGTVTVLYSDGTRIATTGAVQVTQQTSGMPGTAGHKDFFGATLAAGDTHGDGKADLAIYSQGDTYVTVVPGGDTGLRYGSARGWTQNSAGIPGSTEPRDYWGGSLRFEDVKNTGYTALVVGANGENDFRGAFTVIYSTVDGLTNTGVQAFHQDTPGVAGTAEAGDNFGVFF
jgi:hypothetical protein